MTRQVYCTFCGAETPEDDRRWYVLSWYTRNSLGSTLFYYGQAPLMSRHSMLCKDCYLFIKQNEGIIESIDKAEELISRLRQEIRIHEAESSPTY